MSGSYDAVDSSRVSHLDQLKSLYLILKALTFAVFASVPIFFKWLFHLVAPPPLKDISGQLALITGGSAGIGRSIALRLACAGCHIAIVNRNVEMGAKVAEEIRSMYKVNAVAFEADVAKREDVRRLKKAVEESLGNVDILVNNAGLLSLENSLLEGDDEEYQRVIDTNLTSYFWVSLGQ
jgi:all-trans-retinol dehydrogenase (NAD+)